MYVCVRACVHVCRWTRVCLLVKRAATHGTAASAEATLQLQQLPITRPELS